MDELERRVRRLEDLDAIRQLRARYCLYLDTGQWDSVADLFTDDGEFTGMSSPRGREEIRTFFAGLSDSMNGFWHFTTNETIDIDGDRADGEAYLYMTCVLDDEPHVAAGRYRDEFVKQQGRWLFHSRTVTFFYFVPNADGWYPGKIVPEDARRAVDPSVELA